MHTVHLKNLKDNTDFDAIKRKIKEEPKNNRSKARQTDAAPSLYKKNANNVVPTLRQCLACGKIAVGVGRSTTKEVCKAHQTEDKPTNSPTQATEAEQ